MTNDSCSHVTNDWCRLLSEISRCNDKPCPIHCQVGEVCQDTDTGPTCVCATGYQLVSEQCQGGYDCVPSSV